MPLGASEKKPLNRELINAFIEQSHDAVERIRNGVLLIQSRYSNLNFKDYYQKIYGLSDSDHIAWLMDKMEMGVFFVTLFPEIIYPHDKALFTVTSTLALDSLIAGKSLKPAEILLENNLPTHRGLGLAIKDIFLKALRIPDGFVGSAVWVGTQVDPEEIAYQQLIADQGIKLHLEFLSHLFSLLENDDGEIIINSIHPIFLEILNGFIERSDEFHEELAQNQRYKDWLNRFLLLMNNALGIRGGWYLDLQNSFLGTRNFKNRKEVLYSQDWENLLTRLESLLGSTKPTMDVLNDLTGDDIIVIKLRWGRYSERILRDGPIPLLPFRPPHDQIGLASVAIEDIEEIYFKNADAFSKYFEVQSKFGIACKTFEEIEPSFWIKDPTDSLALDPISPTCWLRYRQAGETSEELHKRLSASVHTEYTDWAQLFAKSDSTNNAACMVPLITFLLPIIKYDEMTRAVHDINPLLHGPHTPMEAVFENVGVDQALFNQFKDSKIPPSVYLKSKGITAIPGVF